MYHVRISTNKMSKSQTHFYPLIWPVRDHFSQLPLSCLLYLKVKYSNITVVI